MRHTSKIMVLAALVSLPAWAVGERITVSGANEQQLKEVLCNSMECVSSAQAKANGYSAAVEAKAAKDGVDIKVLGADGRVRTTQHVPMNDMGRLSETDLVSATTEIMSAIEDPDHKAKAEAEKADAKPAKSKKVAKKHPAKGIRLALRGHAARG